VRQDVTKTAILIFLSGICSSVSLAQETPAPVETAAPSPRSMDLKQLIQKGMNYSPDIQKAQGDYKIADEQFSQAEATLFPTLKLTASAQNKKLALSTFGQAGTVRQNQYDAAINLSQPLYAGGAITSGLAAAKLGKQIALQSLFIQKQNFLSQLISGYYDYSQNVERFKQAQINRDFLKNYAAIARQYANIGRTKSIDRLQAEANLASSESAVLENESLLAASRNALLQLIGEKDLTNENIEIIPHLEVKPIEPLTLKQALEKAIESNPEVRTAEMQVRQQEYMNDLDLVEDKARLSLDGSYGYTSPNRDELFDENQNTYMVGVNLTIPLFSGLSSLSKKREHAQLKMQKEKDLMLKQDELRQSLSTAIETLQRDFKRIKNLKEAVELGRRAMDSALKDYRRGLVSSTDVVNIQNKRYSSELELLQVTASYMKQVLSLRRDLGVELEKVYMQ
jgi:outer membrane protein TolC